MVDEASLLQIDLSFSHQSPELIDTTAAQPHYWPTVRGPADQHSITRFPFPAENLTASLAWSKAFGTDLLWSSLIDNQKNIYVSGMTALTKLGPDGRTLWSSPSQSVTAVLMGKAICSQTMIPGRSVYCLSARTGHLFWRKQVYPVTGVGGNMIVGHNGVLLVAAGLYWVEGLTMLTGQANDRVIGLNASTGENLWDFKVNCGLWMLMGLFPDEDTTVFMDQCGGMYRLGLYNGSLLWYTAGEPGTLSDGGAILGPDGSAYGCSMAPGTTLVDNNNPHAHGLLRKLRLSDGLVLWATETPYPCTNIPAVSINNDFVVVAPGAIPPVDGPYFYFKDAILKMNSQDRRAFHRSHEELARNGALRSHYNMTNLTGAIMAFDAHTGEVQWRHELKPYGGITSAGDQKRNWDAFIAHEAFVPHCGPPHFSAVTLDEDGHVYIGDSTGEFRVYNPKTDVESTLHIEDGFMAPGAAFAPGMMVVTTCQSVKVFKS